ncbi:hypothetical protein C5167_023269 [Papaver somniferum]|uniref:Uncharacterized protein n=1 Tax=Papaver somniferum TaxID=3469 RepID=A0A4Y7JNH6_PAPSO|nr:hypothetical protein C5167_023269 [Papaver somniferum]
MVRLDKHIEVSGSQRNIAITQGASYIY